MTVVDERLLLHRLRSTSAAGMVGGLLAIGLWTYRYVFTHQWSWDLFAVAITIIVVKLAVMLWYWVTN